ncbi:TIGR00341 family protein [Sulfurivirga caldicuralii]|uniref:TIGR00341 family protein n=1 Tax=Sulfurivirga caldicuralii TaxID=364032 RepID=A0A1N6F3T0_9GAMM|nr:TIGR00341 family protein [Sulfurivirga caldicuralii]SIN89930.1 TIGR00341 family protein [Sulfurivirga caldicuralii]
MQAITLVLNDEAEATFRTLGDMLPAKTHILSFSQLEDPPPTDTLFMVLNDEEFKEVWRRFADREMELVPLPWDQNPLTREAFFLPDKAEAYLQRLLNDEEPGTGKRQHQLTANGQLVLTTALIGQKLSLGDTSLWARMRLFFQAMRYIHLRPMQLQTANESKIRCACLQIRAADESLMQKRYPSLCEQQPLTGKIAALIYAPQSLVNFSHIFLTKLGLRKKSRMPPGIGLIKTRRLNIKADSGQLPMEVDGEPYLCDDVTLEMTETACCVRTGLPLKVDNTEKETLRTNTLPTSPEAIEFFSKRALPLFPLASEEAYAGLFQQVRESARFTSIYGVMLTLSVLMAALGLFQNSSPVIIGAMILAPLMAPIVSLSLGLVRLDRSLLRDSLRTVVLSILLSLGLAAVFAWLMPVANMTEQMASRIHPTLLDLGVAIVSGLAAAYAYSREEVAKSLAGVAIAVALVPPLTVSGIGIGWGDLHMFWGAMLLFLTNLVGILAAAGVLFFVLGFSSLRTAKTAFVYKLLLLTLITIPLWFSTHIYIQEQRIYQRLENLAHLGYRSYQLPLQVVDVSRINGRPVATVRVTIPAEADESARERLVEFLKKRLGNDVHLILEYRTFYPASSDETQNQ